MRLPLWPNRRDQPPRFGAVEVDWNHPLAWGLTSCVFYGHQPVDLVRPRAMTISNAVPAIGGGGIGIAFDASMDRLIVPSAGMPSATGPGTVIALHESTYVSGYRWLWDTDGGRVACYYNTGYANMIVAYKDARQRYHYVTRADKAQFLVGNSWEKTGDIDLVYWNGVVVAPGAAPTGTWGSNALGSYYYFGDRYASANYALNGMIYYHAAWNRRLTADEHLLLGAEPWCFLRVRHERSYNWKAAGSTAFDGTAALSLAAALADTGGVGWLGAASLASQAAVTDLSMIGWVGAASLPTQAAITALGAAGWLGAATLPAAAALVGAGRLALTGTGTLVTSAATTTGGQEALVGAGTLAAFAALAPVSTWQALASGSLTTAAGIAASRAGITEWLASAVFAVAADMPPSGRLSLAGSSALAQIATLDASARKDLLLTAALGVLGSVQASGPAGWQGASPLGTQAGVTASSRTAAQVTAALQILGALGAQSQAGVTGTLLLTAALALASSNQPSLVAILIDWLAEALVSAAASGDALTAAGASQDALTSAAVGAPAARTANAFTNPEFLTGPGLTEGLGDGTGWQWGSSNDGGTQWVLSLDQADGYFVKGSHTAFIYTNDVLVAGKYRNVKGPQVPVTAGHTYEFSAYIACSPHGGVSSFEALIVWYDAAYTVLGYTFSGKVYTRGALDSFSGYTRVAALGVAPATAVKCVPFFQYLAWSGWPHGAWFTRMQFGERPDGTTSPYPWEPTRGSGLDLNLGTLTSAGFSQETLTPALFTDDTLH